MKCSHILLGFVVALANCRPQATTQLEDSHMNSERATVKVTGNKVAVITGLLITTQLSQCFDNRGFDIAKGWAGALADQWYSGHSGKELQSAQVMWSSYNTRGLFCATFDAIFAFQTSAEARIFATFVSGQLGNTKRQVARSLFDASKMDVYIEGVDLPAGHLVFGSNETEDATPVTVLTKRGLGSCMNRCSFNFTQDQTSECQDTTFPDGNNAYC